jgi:hypothetical protein
VLKGLLKTRDEVIITIKEEEIMGEVVEEEVVEGDKEEDTLKGGGAMAEELM